MVVVQEDKVSVQILAGQSTSDAGSEEMIESAQGESFPDVDFQWVCVDWGDGFAPQMTSRFAAGKMPDILIGKVQDVPVYQALGAILPIDLQACGDVDGEVLVLATVEGEVYGLPYNSLYQLFINIRRSGAGVQSVPAVKSPSWRQLSAYCPSHRRRWRS